MELKQNINQQEIGYERKKIGLSSLQGWDLNTKHNLQLNKKIVDSLYESLEAHLKMSIKRYQNVIDFFNSLQFQLQYKDDIKNQLNDFLLGKWDDQNKKSKYIKNDQLKETISCFYDEFVDFNKNYLNLNESIQNIIKDMDNQLKPYENNLKSLYTQQNQIRKKLKQDSVKTKKNMDEIEKAKKFFIDNKNNKRSSYNTFDYVLNFFISVEDLKSDIASQMEVFSQLYKNFEELEFKRINSIKLMIIKFIQLVEQSFGISDVRFNKTKNLLKNLDTNYCNTQNLDLNRFLEPQQKKLILKDMQQELNLNDIVQFVHKNNKENESKEILNFFYIQKYEALLQRGFLQSDYNVIVFLTLDFYFSIYKVKNNQYQEQVISLPIEQIIINQENKEVIVLQYKQKNLFWNTNKKIHLQMQPEQIEQMLLQYDHFSKIFTKDNSNGDSTRQTNDSTNYVEQPNEIQDLKEEETDDKEDNDENEYLKKEEEKKETS